MIPTTYMSLSRWTSASASYFFPSSSSSKPRTRPTYGFQSLSLPMENFESRNTSESRAKLRKVGMSYANVWRSNMDSHILGNGRGQRPATVESERTCLMLEERVPSKIWKLSNARWVRENIGGRRRPC